VLSEVPVLLVIVPVLWDLLLKALLVMMAMTALIQTNAMVQLLPALLQSLLLKVTLVMMVMTAQKTTNATETESV